MAEAFGDGGRLPERGLLLHIGPHKTGTTSIQGALAAARPRLARRGVIYPGFERQQRMPALAITGTRGVTGLRPARMDEWDKLVEDVYAARRKRVVVSSESFVESDDAIAHQVVEQLGGDRVHVVVTLRPLAKILPSAWQQMVRNRLCLTYEEWLDDILNQPAERRPIVNFWHRHRHEEMIERWLSLVGPNRLVVVVVDEVDRSVLLRAFDQLMGCPEGFLVPDELSGNRGLTRAEAELVRQLNVEFRERGWSSEYYHHVVRLGVVRWLQIREPEPDEARIFTPAWAVERANQIARDASARIGELGVTVMGDLGVLDSIAVDAAEDRGPAADQQLADSVAREALAGLAEQLHHLDTPPPLERNARPVEMIETGELAKIVWDRVVRRTRGKVGMGFVRS